MSFRRPDPFGPGTGPGGGFDPFGGSDPREGGGFGRIGGSTGGGVFSTSSTELAEASITITSPKGPLVDPEFRVEGTASIRMHTREFIKAGGQGQTFEFDTFVTDGFTVTVRLGDEEHQATVSKEGNRLHWSLDVADVDTGDVTITALLDGTVTERSATSHGFSGTPEDVHTETKRVHRADSMDVTVEQGDVAIDASIQNVMIGSPFEATIEGTVESEFDIESVQVEPNNWLGSLDNLSGDWSNWRAVIELPDRNSEQTITVSARNEVDHGKEFDITVPTGEPFIEITKPAQNIETYLWQDGGITVDIEGTTSVEHSTIQTVKWRLSNIDNVREGEATETADNWSEWRIDLDLNRALTHILEIWAVDADGTTSRVSDSSTRELRVQVFRFQGFTWPFHRLGART